MSRPIRRALIAVYDKTGIVEFARALVDEFGIEIISTGGTAKHLKEAGIPVTMVEEVTGFPELLDGRVKTLHPKIHAGILADRDNPEHMRQLEQHGIKPIDMVVVNLYPFEKTVADPNCTFEQAIEMIDIGGPCMLRAAAKNRKHVAVVSDSTQLPDVLNRLREFRGHISEGYKHQFAAGVFWKTNQYDRRIWEYLNAPLEGGKSLLGDRIDVRLQRLGDMRYGENPHQRASKYDAKEVIPNTAHFEARYPLGPERALSFNNHLDADAAFNLCADISQSLSTNHAFTCVFIKHNNACGVGIADSPTEAYQRAYLGDPKAAMGGVLAMNCKVDGDLGTVVSNTLERWGKSAGAGAFFVELWLANSFDQECFNVVCTSKKWGANVQFLEVGEMRTPWTSNSLQIRSLAGGVLVQTPDLISLNEDQWKVVTKRAPSESERADLRLSWLIAKHTKSNAISICKDGMLIGNGAGQMSRVMSCRIATWLAKENKHEDKLKGSAAASDAFFPFRDGPDILMDAGVTAIIQPGGSKRDDDTIKACDERGVAMIFTGTRHFKH